jgi:hypothetical protein
MPLRPPEEKQPFLDERLQAEQVAEGWTLMAAFSGGLAVLLAGTAPVTVPVGLIAAVFAYSFRKRKAACDAVIDDPPRYDYQVNTRPQRGWFKPEALTGRLTEAQIALASELAEGDALLRAAVRADERAQGAYLDGRLDLADWQANMSDAFFDAFVTRQPIAADLAAVVSEEVRAEPAFRAVRPIPGPERSLSQVLDPNVRESLLEAGVSATALGEMRTRGSSVFVGQPADVVSDELREYGSGERRRAEALAGARSRRATAEDRVRSFAREHKDLPRND